LAPGLVLVKGALDEGVQQRLAALAWEVGGREGSGGFWETPGGGASGKSPRLNNAPGRGRIYRQVAEYDAWVTELCFRQVELARKADPCMPAMKPTHLVLLYYASNGGKAWHRDEGENDGRGEEPVVSLSVGDACDFALRPGGRREDDGLVMRLESGDAVIFGGPCRQALHAVLDIHPGTSPAGQRGRFNFTFRAAPEVLGREEEFRLMGAYARERFGGNWKS